MCRTPIRWWSGSVCVHRSTWSLPLLLAIWSIRRWPWSLLELPFSWVWSWGWLRRSSIHSLPRSLRPMITWTIASRKILPICAWSSPMSRKKKRRLSLRRLLAWSTTCSWRPSASWSWVVQPWCYPCMLPLSWFLGSGHNSSWVEALRQVSWPLCLPTSWPSSCLSWCLWWSSSCSQSLWHQWSGSMKCLGQSQPSSLLRMVWQK